MTRKEIISYIKEAKGLSDYIKIKYKKSYVQICTEDLEREIKLYKRRIKTSSNNSKADTNIVSNTEVQEANTPTLSNEDRLTQAYTISNKINRIKTALEENRKYLQKITDLDLTAKDTNNNPIKYLITCTGSWSDNNYKYYNIEVDNTAKKYLIELLNKEIAELEEQLVILRNEFTAL